jgi:hypothetical protein
MTNKSKSVEIFAASNIDGVAILKCDSLREAISRTTALRAFLAYNDESHEFTVSRERLTVTVKKVNTADVPRQEEEPLVRSPLPSTVSVGVEESRNPIRRIVEGLAAFFAVGGGTAKREPGGSPSAPLQVEVLGAAALASHVQDDVSTETAEAVAIPQPRAVLLPTANFVGKNKGWFYQKDEDGRTLILAFVNAKGSCSMRPFDYGRNTALGKRYGRGDYQKSFADYLVGAQPLTVDRQPNLERECKDRLPTDTLEYLRNQIDSIEKAEAGRKAKQRH